MNIATMVERLSAVSQANGGPATTPSDYLCWKKVTSEGFGYQFQQAVETFLGKETVEVAEVLDVVEPLLFWALKLGPRKVNGKDLHRVLRECESPALEYRG